MAVSATAQRFRDGPGRAGRAVRAALTVVRSRDPWAAVLFLLTSLPLGFVWFVGIVVLLVLGLALSLALIGLPLLLLALLLTPFPGRARRWRLAASFWVTIPLLALKLATLGGRVERRRLGRAFGVAIPRPDRSSAGGSWPRRVRDFGTDPAAWRDLVYLVLLFPIGLAEFVIAWVLIWVPLSLIATPTYYWASNTTLVGPDLVIETLPQALLAMLVGLALLIPAKLGLVGTARGHLAFAQWILGGAADPRLVERVDELTKSRTAVMEAMLAERRRIERDLHDGVQQRLVALAMDLGMAREKLDADPDAARALVATSHDEAKRVLAELRDLVRGIHPAVLTDRGLDAAISAVAGRSPIPVTTEVALDERLPEAVEATAYFVVVEALANVAKHSNATEARVAVRRNGDRLAIEVLDNGAGGADPTRGTGLLGLRDRVAALDGRLAVESPPKGPTRVRAEIPCGP